MCDLKKIDQEFKFKLIDIIIWYFRFADLIIYTYKINNFDIVLDNIRSDAKNEPQFRIVYSPLNHFINLKNNEKWPV